MRNQANHPIFNEWLDVQAQAHQADVRLLYAHLHQAAWGGEIPAEWIEKAGVLRLRASFLLPEALAEMERVARSLRPDCPLEES